MLSDQTTRLCLPPATKPDAMKMNFKIVSLLAIGLTGAAASDATELLEPTVFIVLLVRYAHSMRFVR